MWYSLGTNIGLTPSTHARIMTRYSVLKTQTLKWIPGAFEQIPPLSSKAILCFAYPYPTLNIAIENQARVPVERVPIELFDSK